MNDKLWMAYEFFENIGGIWSIDDVRRMVEGNGNTWTIINDGLCRLSYPIGLDINVYHEHGVIFLMEAVIEMDDINGLDIVAHEEVVHKYFNVYNDYVKWMSNRINIRPIFDDGMAAKGFPDDQDAIWLALWKSKWGRFMIANKHEGEGFPIRITAMAAPN